MMQLQRGSRVQRQEVTHMSKWWQWLILCFALLIGLMSGQIHAETATAVDEEAEALVLNKIIRPQSSSAQLDQQTPSSTATVAPKTIENDMQDGQSYRDLPSFKQPVIDQAKVLTQTEAAQLDRTIRQIYEQGKAQIGIVIVPTTGQEGIFDFAMRSAEAWGLGSAKRDNGLLIAVAINDRKLHIATGYGLEGVIPDIVAGRIIRDQITPYFKQGQYGQGLIAGVNEIERILNLDPEIAQQAADELKERQEQALKAENAKGKTINAVLIILLIGILASFIFGNGITALVAGVTSFAAGMIFGSGLLVSLLIGFGVFFLLVTSIAQFIFSNFGGGSGGRSGGGFGGGGFGGGGGGFGGGGASGSW